MIKTRNKLQRVMIALLVSALFAGVGAGFILTAPREASAADNVQANVVIKWTENYGATVGYIKEAKLILKTDTSKTYSIINQQFTGLVEGGDVVNAGRLTGVVTLPVDAANVSLFTPYIKAEMTESYGEMTLSEFGTVSVFTLEVVTYTEVDVFVKWQEQYGATVDYIKEAKLILKSDPSKTYSIVNQQFIPYASNGANTDRGALKGKAYLPSGVIAAESYDPYIKAELTESYGEMTLNSFGIVSAYVLVESAIVVPLPANPTKTGHTFSGWYFDSACTNAYDDRPITAATNLYAGFRVNQYTVAYNVNGGTTIAAKTADYDTTYTLPVPVRTGYAFEGWYTTVGLSEASKVTTATYTVPANNVTLYAKWSSSAVTITYVTNGGTAINPYSGLAGASYTLPTAARAGFTFEGWYTDSALTAANKVNMAYTIPASNVTLYAKWTAVAQVTVTFNVNGGTAIAPQTLDAGGYCTLPTPVRAGYTFKGWYTNSSLSEASKVISPYIVNESLTVYAKWEVIKCVVTFYVDGVVFKTIEVDYGTKLSEYVATEAALDGYVFS